MESYFTDYDGMIIKCKNGNALINYNGLYVIGNLHTKTVIRYGCWEDMYKYFTEMR